MLECWKAAYERHEQSSMEFRALIFYPSPLGVHTLYSSDWFDRFQERDICKRLFPTPANRNWRRCVVPRFLVKVRRVTYFFVLVTGVIGTITDISDQRLLEESRLAHVQEREIEARRRAEEAEERRKEADERRRGQGKVNDQHCLHN